MSRFLYSLIFYLLLPWLLVRLWFRGFKATAYRKRWQQRFGYGLEKVLSRDEDTKGLLWVHSVSVGETLAAIPLIRQLQTAYPNKRVLVTTMTPTGSERVLAAFGNKVTHCYLPYDLPFAVSRFLKHFQPEILLIMETELWPNLIAQCKHQKVPVVVVNARLSERSARGYQRFKSLSAEMLKGIAVAAQTSDDAERFINLGAERKLTLVSGNIKYELILPEKIQQQADSLRAEVFAKNSLIWIAASTHQNEDEQVLQIHRQILKRNPRVKLIIVPRHPERFDRVAELCIEQGYKVNRRSQLQKNSADSEIFIGDTMGELLLFFAMADVAFIGGSLVATGGHNPLEAAAFSCPVVVGPHTFNFQQITSEMICLGAVVQADAGGMPLAILNWLEDVGAREKAGKAGAKFVQDNRGALKKIMSMIETQLDEND